MDSADVKDCVLAWLRFERQYPYISTECGSFNADCVATDGETLVEVEVKVSIADLRREFSKDKHTLHYPDAPHKKLTKHSHTWLPHQFYIAVPHTLDIAKVEKAMQDWSDLMKNPPKPTPDWRGRAVNRWSTNPGLVDKYGIIIVGPATEGTSGNVARVHKKAMRLHTGPVTEKTVSTMGARMASELITLRQNLHSFMSNLKNSTLYHAKANADTFELKQELKRYQNFVDRIAAGYAGMFGDNATSPEKHCYEWLYQELLEFKPELKKEEGNEQQKS